MPATKQTLYEILRIPRDASIEDVKVAYEQRVAELEHASPPDPGAAALARQAFEVLTQPHRRQQYDASLASAGERAAAPPPPREAEVEMTPEVVERRKRLSWPLFAAIAALSLAILYFALRPDRLPDPQNEAASTAEPAPSAQAPKPAPPPPPKERTAAEILKDATAASAVLSSIEMSGRSTPIAIALVTEPGVMVTTCHGLPAGAKLVVQMGNERLPADQGVTDEELDLCRLSVPGLAAKPLAIATEEPKPGDRIFTTGINSAGQFAVTEGTVKQLRKVPAGNVLELSMPVAATGSGGGVFDVHGRLVAIATTQYRHASGDNIALSATWLTQLRSRAAAK